MKNSLLLVAFALAFAGCMRGGISELPPVHLVLDMDFQPKLKAQSKTAFDGWHDGRSMRAPVADANGKTAVVARGSLPNADLAHRDANNAFRTTNPVPVSAAVLARGQERFDIHCSVCHGYSGRGGNDPVLGNGMVGRRWPVVIPSFHYAEGKDAVANRVPLLPDGEVFEYITFGKGTMPPYGARISPEDRWAIIHYVRALQQLSK
ncbi:MAG: cytochrome c [Planctomycetota bacterium]|nr:cytochrome c [Planctomycetota bacterium]